MESLEYYRRKVAEYEDRMGIGENNPAKEGYLVLVDILKQQNEYLSNVKISEMITIESKSNAASEYERAKALWEKLPTMIQNVSSLKIELKMEGEEKRNTYKPISARKVADEEDV